MFYLFSTIALILIGLGLLNRQQPRRHIPLMLSAFLLDLTLVLLIEWNRHAIRKFSESLHAPLDHTLLLFHITISLLTLVLYVSMMITGFLTLSGRRNYLKWHRVLALLFIVCRLTNYVTSFFITGDFQGDLQETHSTVMGMPGG